MNITVYYILCFVASIVENYYFNGPIVESNNGHIILFYIILCLTRCTMEIIQATLEFNRLSLLNRSRVRNVRVSVCPHRLHSETPIFIYQDSFETIIYINK